MFAKPLLKRHKPFRIKAYALAAALVALGGTGFVAPPDGARAGQVQPVGKGLHLLMIERAGCVWCRRFDAEIAPGYAAHPQGARAPLVRLDIDGPFPDGLALARRPYLTPSFILIRDGIEIDRIEGYVGSQQFWPVTSALIAKAGGSR